MADAATRAAFLVRPAALQRVFGLSSSCSAMNTAPSSPCLPPCDSLGSSSSHHMQANKRKELQKLLSADVNTDLPSTFATGATAGGLTSNASSLDVGLDDSMHNATSYGAANRAAARGTAVDYLSTSRYSPRSAKPAANNQAPAAQQRPGVQQRGGGSTTAAKPSAEAQHSRATNSSALRMSTSSLHGASNRSSTNLRASASSVPAPAPPPPPAAGPAPGPAPGGGAGPCQTRPRGAGAV
jgi:hypothetical protein